MSGYFLDKHRGGKTFNTEGAEIAKMSHRSTMR